MAGSALESAAVTAQFTRSNYLETEITDRWHFRWTRPPAGGEQKGAKFDLRLPGGGTVRFSPLTANAVGQARATLSSHYTGHLPAGSWLVIRMGTGRRGVAANPIAVTRPLAGR